MKRAIAGILLLVGLSAVLVLAGDGDRGLRGNIRHDDKIAQNRRGRRDLDYGNYAAAPHERRELRREYRDRRDRDWC
jgi:hypothetical protein